MWGDASVVLGIMNRKELGETRHMETGLLRIQQTAADQRLKYLNVLGRENPADLYTTFVDNAASDGHVKRFEYSFIEGRSREAPRLHIISQSIDECNYGDQYEHCESIQILLKEMETNTSHRKHQRGVGNVNSMTQRACQNAKWGVNKLSSKIDNCDGQP